MGIVEVDWHTKVRYLALFFHTSLSPIFLRLGTQNDIRRDGSIRPYNQKYSTIHGWVTKLRGTLSDNERVRREGIREMRAAKAVRQWKKKHGSKSQKRKGGSSSGGGFLSLFGLGSKKPSSSRAVVTRDSSRRSTNKGSSDATLHFSTRQKPSRSSSSKVSGSLTQSRTTGSSRPVPQRRQTDAPRRQQSTRDSRPTRHNTRRSTRP
jgi:hypothetical protein